MKGSKLSSIRREYRHGALLEEKAGNDPLALFEQWLNEALQSGNSEPTAMTLATVGNDGHVSARMVLLKDVSSAGFSFFTSYNSLKGRQLAVNPRAAMVFFWPEPDRQVRAEGKVIKLSPEESDRYFSSRPEESQLGAWASSQSSTVPSREYLEEQLARAQNTFCGKKITRPPHWGGFRLQPEMIEFWQGRPGRLHDRLVYRRNKGEWLRERLAP